MKEWSLSSFKRGSTPSFIVLSKLKNLIFEQLYSARLFLKLENKITFSILKGKIHPDYKKTIEKTEQEYFRPNSVIIKILDEEKEKNRYLFHYEITDIVFLPKHFYGARLYSMTLPIDTIKKKYIPPEIFSQIKKYQEWYNTITSEYGRFPRLYLAFIEDKLLSYEEFEDLIYSSVQIPRC